MASYPHDPAPPDALLYPPAASPESPHASDAHDVHDPHEGTAADDHDDDGGKRKKGSKRRKVNHACLYCRRSHMTCDEGRPCQRW